MIEFDYDCEFFDNYEMFSHKYPKEAQELLKMVDEGEWQDDQLILYPSVEDYAVYELTEGWYANSFGNVDSYNGAPNPLEYIDLESFGDALLSTVDASVVQELSNGNVISTTYGW